MKDSMQVLDERRILDEHALDSHGAASSFRLRQTQNGAAWMAMKISRQREMPPETAAHLSGA
eukprot:607596-Amphidinium_carterae.1